MTPAARISAAIDILDQVLAGGAAEQALLRWSRGSRFAGSGDRGAVRDLVFEALRRRNSLAAMGGGLTGRGLMIGLCRASGLDLDAIFTGQGYAPAALTEAEQGGSADSAIDLPDWLIDQWRESLGEQADEIAAAMTERAPVWLRVNPARGSVETAIKLLEKDEITVEQSPELTKALRVIDGERRIKNSRAYRDGLIELQDLSPQLACDMLHLHPGDRVLDYCAGGGGKVLALAGQGSDLRLFAHDDDPARMADLPKRASRAGVDVTLTKNPQGRFELVVVDVPCSGSGTWRRAPDAKWRLTAEMLEQMTVAQANILRKATEYVAPGGRIIYMTCSFLSVENEEIIRNFLADAPEFSEVENKTWTPLTASDGFFLSIIKHARK